MTKRNREMTQHEQIEAQKKGRMDEATSVMKQVKALLADVQNCTFSFYNVKDSMCCNFCAVKLTPYAYSEKKVEYESVYFMNNMTFEMKKRSGWINADDLKINMDNDTLACVEQFIRLTPISVWAEFVICKGKHTQRFLPMTHNTCLPGDELSKDVLFMGARWVSLDPVFFGASLNIVMEDNGKVHVGMMIHSSKYVYLAIEKAKARVVLQCVRDEVSKSLRYRAYEKKQDDDAAKVARYGEEMDSFMADFENSQS